MRIQIHGDNPAAHEARHRLQLAGFLVSTVQPDFEVTLTENPAGTDVEFVAVASILEQFILEGLATRLQDRPIVLFRRPLKASDRAVTIVLPDDDGLRRAVSQVLEEAFLRMLESRPRLGLLAPALPQPLGGTDARTVPVSALESASAALIEAMVVLLRAQSRPWWRRFVAVVALMGVMAPGLLADPPDPLPSRNFALSPVVTLVSDPGPASVFLALAQISGQGYDPSTNTIRVQCVSGCSGGGGGAVTIADPNTPTQQAAVNASGQLSITCANCSGSGASAVDNSAFTAGTTSGAPAMGFYHSTIDTVTDGRSATLAMDSKRNLFGVIRDAAGNARGVNVTAGNALTVDASATTQPVSGTFWQATQPVSGTFFQATQPISVADGGDVTQGAKADAKSAATDTTAITLMQVFKEISFMEQNPASRAVTNAGTFAAQATLQTQTDTVMVGGVNIKEINAVTPLMGNGSTGTGSQRVTIASDNTAFAVNGTLQTQTDTVMVGGVNVKEINAVTPLMGNGATGTGAMRVSIANDSTGVVQPGNTANTTPWLVQAVPGAASGLTFYNVEPAASDNHVNIKNGAGVVYHISAFNNSATVNYYRLYNAATGFNGCNSATNLQWSGIIPASASGTGFVEDIGAGITFSTGISVCITGAYGQTSTTNATATAIEFNVGYK